MYSKFVFVRKNVYPHFDCSYNYKFLHEYHCDSFILNMKCLASGALKLYLKAHVRVAVLLGSLFHVCMSVCLSILTFKILKSTLLQHSL